MTSKHLNLFLLLAFIALTSCTSENRNNNTLSSQETSSGVDFPNTTLQKARLFTTSQIDNQKLTDKGELAITDFGTPSEHDPTLFLDAGKRFQTIEGFGGALTDASAETFYLLPKDKQEELMEAYFDIDKGIGYSMARTHIHSCDFSSESYAYSEVTGDTKLEHFSIAHDEKFKIPFIKEAIEKTNGKLKMLASPWSPPAWMKTNNNMLQGGQLKPEYFQTWADYFVKFFDAYQKHDIPFWGLTVQNEPMAVQRWESCIFTAEEEKNFVRDYLGPTLEKNNREDLKVIIWDHNRGLMYQRAKLAFDDEEASKYIWGTGFHWYTGDHFENVKLVQEAFPDKKTIFTEGCVFPFNYDSLHVWHWGERYGESIIHDLNNSATGWIDWNILLNQSGGPNHVANYCYAPVIGNTDTGELTYMNSFYYLGHFSKFIRPGAQRIVCSSNFDNLLATAFINPDKTIAVVAMNQSDQDISYKIWMEGKGTEAILPAHSISTIVIN